MKNKIFRTIGYLFLLAGLGFPGFGASGQTIEWQKCFGGYASDDAHYAIQTNDGGYFFTGVTGSFDADITSNSDSTLTDWIVKLDADRNIQWQKCIDSGQFVYAIQTSDNGFILTGHRDTSGYDAEDDLWVLKLSSLGSVEWEKRFGGSGKDRGFSVIETNDGGYLVAGSTESSDGDVSHSKAFLHSSDAWLIKLNHNGSLKWEKTYGADLIDAARKIIKTDEGYTFVGYSGWNPTEVRHMNRGSLDVWVVQLDTDGNMLSQNFYGGSHEELGYDILQTSDKGYFILGSTNSHNYDVVGLHADSVGLGDIWALKLNKLGDIDWQKCIGGSGWDVPVSAFETNKGNFILGGCTSSKDGDAIGSHNIAPPDDPLDIIVAELSSSGQLLWSKCFGGSLAEILYSMTRTADDHCLLAGLTYSNDDDVSPRDKNTNGSVDAWLVKLSPNLSDVRSGIGTTDQFTMYPNPATISSSLEYTVSNSSVAQINVFNVLGKNVLQTEDKSGIIGKRTIIIDVNKLPKGIYFLKLQCGGMLQTQKLIVAH